MFIENMMEDCELLSLAAKAAGAEWSDYSDRTPDHWMFKHSDGVWRKWEPLTNDGDALRLAVKLRIHIEWVFTSPGAPEYVQASPKTLGHCSDMQPIGNDVYAAIRRAIVCAAAQVGRTMN